MAMIRAIMSSDSLGGPGAVGEYILAPEVILLLVHDGTARLLDMDGRFYAVSAVGCEILEGSLTRGTAVAVSRVAAHYGEDTARVHQDAAAFLDRLEMCRLIRRRTPYGRGRRPSDFAPFLFLAPALRFVEHHVHSLSAKAWGLLALARGSFALFGWARTLAAWQRYYNGHPSGELGPDADTTARIIDDVVRATAAQHVFAIGCKERSLCCWALLRSAGLPGTVVLGVDLFPLASHCWCEYGSVTLSDYEDHCEKFSPVRRYG